MLDHVLAGDEKGLISDVKLKIEIRLASLMAFFSLALALLYSIILYVVMLRFSIDHLDDLAFFKTDKF